jgi:sugar lactone lactonase YvrE
MKSGVDFELVGTIPSSCVLGEGPVWDARIGVLWFTDIQASRLLRFDWHSGELRRYATPERLGSLGLTTDPGQLVCALASGFARYEPESGRCDWIVRTEPDYRGIRMNDGRIDRAGRFWAGSMIEDKALAAGAAGSLYRLDRADGSPPARLLDGIAISNSICFAPDGLRLYFTDTPTQEIAAFDLDPATGTIANRQTLARLAGGAFPDGSDVDADGRVWNAEWGSGKVTAYGSDGTVQARIELPVSQATCIAFGGPDLDHLFVTTAREGLSEAELARQPQAGNVFIYRTGIRGLAAGVFAD